MKALGVGPPPIPQRKLTADRLARAIRQAVTDVRMRHQAAELGEKIRAEDGVANALAAMEEYLGAAATRGASPASGSDRPR